MSNPVRTADVPHNPPGPTVEEFLAEVRLPLDLVPTLKGLGADLAIDLLDLEAHDISELKLPVLQQKRLLRALDTLRGTIVDPHADTAHSAKNAILHSHTPPHVPSYGTAQGGCETGNCEQDRGYTVADDASSVPHAGGEGGGSRAGAGKADDVGLKEGEDEFTMNFKRRTLQVQCPTRRPPFFEFQ